MNNIKHGKGKGEIIIGVLKFANGEIYDGEWKNGNMNGEGISMNNNRNLLLY